MLEARPPPSICRFGERATGGAGWLDSRHELPPLFFYTHLAPLLRL